MVALTSSSSSSSSPSLKWSSFVSCNNTKSKKERTKISFNNFVWPFDEHRYSLNSTSVTSYNTHIEEIRLRNQCICYYNRTNVAQSILHNCDKTQFYHNWGTKTFNASPKEEASVKVQTKHTIKHLLFIFILKANSCSNQQSNTHTHRTKKKKENGIFSISFLNKEKW